MKNLSRRSVVAGACLIFAASFVSFPTIASSAVQRLKDGRLSVNVRALKELSQIGGAVRVGKIKDIEIGVVRTGKTTFRALSLACPHQGVTVIPDGGGWLCPAHNSEFEPNGELRLGPATRNLTRVPSRLSRGQLIVGWFGIKR